MAKLAIEPLVVASINALLASADSREPGSTLSPDEIIELFEMLMARPTQREKVWDIPRNSLQPDPR